MGDVKTRKSKKIDLAELIGPLDSPEEPKTLEECLHEAGGFPFVARAVATTTLRPEHVLGMVPVGAEIRLTKISVNPRCVGFYESDFCFDRGRAALDPRVHRWALVGHRT